MRCKSTSVVTTDCYRAGAHVGDALRDLAPEVVFLFASIDYEKDFPGLFDGLLGALDSTPIVVGCTSDGINETDTVTRHGVCALGLTSDGQAKWTASVRQGVATDSHAVARECALQVVGQLQGQADFAIAFADGVKADGSQIVAGLSSVLKIPFAGGLASDDRKFKRSWVLVNDRAYDDAVAVLAARGRVPFLLNSASGWSPIGDTGQVEKSVGSRVERISGMTAQAFMREQIGKSPGEADLGIVPLATYDPAAAGHFFLRAPSAIDPSTGAVTMFGSVSADSSVRVCTATLDDVLRGVDDAMKTARQGGFEPVGAIIISCAGRRWLLEERSREEVQRVLAAVGRRVPLAGLASFGEIGPFRNDDGTYTPTFFHNDTFVICLLGA